MPAPAAPLTDLLETLSNAATGRETVTVAEIRSALGARRFGPLLFVPAMIEMSPIGGIPGLPTAIASLIALFAIQIALGRHHLWLPAFVEKRALGSKPLCKAVSWLQAPSRWIDRIIKPRLTWATRRPCLNMLGILCLTLAATVPALELIPFASTIPMAAIALLGLAVMARDGLIALFAIAVSGGAFYSVLNTFVI